MMHIKRHTPDFIYNFPENRSTIAFLNIIEIRNGVRDGNPHRTCGPGWPGSVERAVLVGDGTFYFIQETISEEIFVTSY